MKAIRKAPEIPSARLLYREARVVADVARMTLPLLGASLMPAKPALGSRIILIPGFGADDRYTRPMRHFLTREGFPAEGWGLGRNMAGLDLPHSIDDLSPGWKIDRSRPYRGEASVPYLADRLAGILHGQHEETGQAVTLIGWSLGGYLAREAARDLPAAVERVITLGSPVVGGPKYTAAAPAFTRRGLDLDWIEEEVTRREERPIRQPVTAIFSKSDAIVDWGAAIDHHSPNVTHVEIDAAHLGLVFNPTVWRIVLDVLKNGNAASATAA